MFEVGDKVWSVSYGWGVVVEISVEKNNVCPVCVEFENFTTSFTLEGKSFIHGFRDLFFEEIPIPNLALERPRKTAEQMLKECKEVEFKIGEDNFYICYSHARKAFYTSSSIFIECLGIKYISKEDADKIIRECKENNN